MALKCNLSPPTTSNIVSGANTGYTFINSATPTPIVNSSITITTSGGPVVLFWNPAPEVNSIANNQLRSINANSIIYFYRGATLIAQVNWGPSPIYPASNMEENAFAITAIRYIDIVPAGTYNYVAYGSSNGPYGGNLAVVGSYWTAWEIR